MNTLFKALTARTDRMCCPLRFLHNSAKLLRARLGVVLGVGAICLLLMAPAAQAERSRDAPQLSGASREARPCIKDGDYAGSTHDGADTLLVFIHGLFGDARDTWLSPSSHLSLPDLAIDSCGGYCDAYAFSFPSSLTGGFSVAQAARRVDSIWTHCNFNKYYKNIIMIAHSMGGLVAIEALTTYPQVREFVSQVVTYSTPFNGADLARLALYISPNRGLPDLIDIDKSNGFLESLRNRWMERNLENSIPVKCFYELNGARGAGVIVGQGSASALCAGPPQPIAKDHISIVKPDKATEDSVIFLADIIRLNRAKLQHVGLQEAIGKVWGSGFEADEMTEWHLDDDGELIVDEKRTVTYRSEPQRGARCLFVFSNDSSTTFPSAGEKSLFVDLGRVHTCEPRALSPARSIKYAGVEKCAPVPEFVSTTWCACLARGHEFDLGGGDVMNYDHEAIKIHMNEKIFPARPLFTVELPAHSEEEAALFARAAERSTGDCHPRVGQ